MREGADALYAADDAPVAQEDERLDEDLAGVGRQGGVRVEEEGGEVTGKGFGLFRVAGGDLELVSRPISRTSRAS
jgi:hypothetical protein